MDRKIPKLVCAVDIVVKVDGASSTLETQVLTDSTPLPYVSFRITAYDKKRKDNDKYNFKDHARR